MARNWANSTWHIVANGFPGDLVVAADGASGSVLGSPMVGFQVTDTSMSFHRQGAYEQFYSGSAPAEVAWDETDPTFVAMGFFLQLHNGVFTGPYLWSARIHLVG